MISRMRIVLATVALGGGLAVAGCQSSSTRSDAATTKGAQAVACSKCKVTWVQTPVPGNDKNRITTYSSRKVMECPDCRAAVQNFFAGGKFEHACKSCGPDALETCEVH